MSALKSAEEPQPSQFSKGANSKDLNSIDSRLMLNIELNRSELILRHLNREIFDKKQILNFSNYVNLSYKVISQGLIFGRKLSPEIFYDNHDFRIYLKIGYALILTVLVKRHNGGEEGSFFYPEVAKVRLLTPEPVHHSLNLGNSTSDYRINPIRKIRLQSSKSYPKRLCFAIEDSKSNHLYELRYDENFDKKYYRPGNGVPKHLKNYKMTKVFDFHPNLTKIRDSQRSSWVREKLVRRFVVSEDHLIDVSLDYSPSHGSASSGGGRILLTFCKFFAKTRKVLKRVVKEVPHDREAVREEVQLINFVKIAMEKDLIVFQKDARKNVSVSSSKSRVVFGIKNRLIWYKVDRLFFNNELEILEVNLGENGSDHKILGFR